MSTYKTPKGNKVEVNWRNHASKGPEDVDYLLDQVDQFSDSVKAYHGLLDNVSVVYHVTKNKPKEKVAAEKPAPEKKGVVRKVVNSFVGKKTKKKR